MGEPEVLASRPPGVMISSTLYDLHQVRDDVRRFIEGLGYRALVSEHSSFPIDPDATTVENCRRRVEHDADVLVLVIGGRYGTVDARTNASVTNLEYTSARHKRIPVYAFVEPQILALLPVWRANPRANFSGQVDTPRVFEFIEQVRTADSVWMQEFRNADEIVAALRTQFSYQQYRGLRLQRQLLGDSDQDWYGSLRGDALRIALDQPPMWEFLLFGAALTDAVGRHRKLARRHDLKLPLGLGEDVRDPMPWIRARFSDAMRLATTLNMIFNDTLQEGLGPPGQPGDVEKIAFVTDTIGDLYRNALAWALRLRTANVDERFEPLVESVADMLDHVIAEVETFGPYVTRTVQDALAAPKTDERRVLTLTLTISVPDGAMRKFNDQIHRLEAEA